MLLQFTVENFRSISDEVELSMRTSEAVPRRDADQSRPLVSQLGDDLELLRCAAIYGANASGKSNLVEAMLVARQLVVHGTSSMDARLWMQPFRLDAERRGRPSRFEFYLFVSGRIYGYGFAATDKAVIEESLTMLIHGEEKEVFSRQGGHIQLSDVLLAKQDDPKFVEYVARGTPENQLFLHEAKLRNVENQPIGDVFQWFEDHLKVIKPSTEFTQLVELADSDSDFRAFLVSVASWADTGIKGLVVDRHHLGDDRTEIIYNYRLRRSLGRDFDGPMALVTTNDGGMEELSLKLRHSDDASHPTFGLEDESDGTRRLLNVAPLLYLAARGGGVLVIDELDRSLHTLLAQQIVETFIEHLPATTQLIFTTHDTNLLDCRSLRPDCIWFTEKSPAGATSLYSLAEFPPEQIEVLSRDLEKGYLRGRFGAIPFLGDPARLGWVPRKDGKQ